MKISNNNKKRNLISKRFSPKSDISVDTHTFRECTMNAERERKVKLVSIQCHILQKLYVSRAAQRRRAISFLIRETGLYFFFFRKKKIYNNLILILVCPLFFMARCNQARKRQHTKIPSLTCLVTFYKLKKVLYAKHVQLGGIKKI